MFVRNSGFAVANVATQAGAIFATNYDIIWPMFIVMAMMTYMILMQSIAAGSLFSGFVQEDIERPKSESYSILILVALTYMLSSYQTYALGYELFAGFMFSHAIIYLLTNVFGAIRDD